MRLVLVFCISVIFVTTSNCQDKSARFKNFVTKFTKVELPIDVSNVTGELFSNDLMQSIQKSDWSAFLNTDGGDWKYLDGYDYKTAFSFSFDNLIVLAYHRAYYPDNILDERSEYVINIYDQGELLSTLPVQGIYGDDETFFCFINEDLEITITRETFSLNSSNESEMKSIVEKYRINLDTGKISRVQ